MRLFRVLLLADLGIAAVIGLIFCVGLVDSIDAGHFDQEDLLSWPPLVAAIGSVLGGGCWLRSRGQMRAANGVLLLMAGPGLIAALLLLYLVEELLRPGAWR